MSITTNPWIGNEEYAEQDCTHDSTCEVHTLEERRHPSHHTPTAAESAHYRKIAKANKAYRRSVQRARNANLQKRINRANP